MAAINFKASSAAKMFAVNAVLNFTEVIGAKVEEVRGRRSTPPARPLRPSGSRICRRSITTYPIRKPLVHMRAASAPHHCLLVQVGFKYVPGFHRFDRAMQVVADKLNLALGLEVENAGETIVPQSQIRSDML